MEWDPSLESGIATIDYEHKELVRQIGRLTESDSQHPERTEEMLRFLTEYVVKHFAHEQVMHKQTAFDGAREHRDAHEKFIATCGELAQEFKAKGNDPELLKKLVDAVQAWLINHIMGMDKKFAEYYKRCLHLEIIHTDSKNPDFVKLCAELDQDLVKAAGNEVDQAAYNRLNRVDDLYDAFVAYASGDNPIGCAAFKVHPNGVAEVKRMFVLPKYRGKGVAQILIAALEEEAVRREFSSLILETGKHLDAARALYRKMGFSEIPNFGPYRDMPNSVCMGKPLEKEYKRI